MQRQHELSGVLKRGMEAVVRDSNPWWRGERLFGVPPMKRWAFGPLLKALHSDLAPAVVLRGPRQIGKTTLLNQIVDSLLDEGIEPHRILRLQFDDLPSLRNVEQPILELARWFSEHVLGKSFNKAAQDGEQAYLLLDEVQNLADWAPQLKHLVDIHPVRVLVTGSSALRIEAGRDSLAGRITTFDMGPLLLREIAALRGEGEIEPWMPPNGLQPLREKSFWLGLRNHGEVNRGIRDGAYDAFSERGAYPVAHRNRAEPWERVADQLNETVIRRAISHDLRMGPRGQRRDPQLLEEVFRLACRYIGQAPAAAVYVEELRQGLHSDVGTARVFNYLKFLDGTLLLRLIEPLEMRLKRQRALRKICLCDHALRAAWLQERIPLAPASLARHPELSVLAGRVAESTAGYFLSSITNLDVAHFPERGAEPEVDFVLTIGEQRIPVEVKYRRRIDFGDTLGLRAFVEKTHYNAPFGLLISLSDDVVVDDPRIVPLPLSTLLMMR